MKSIEPALQGELYGGYYTHSDSTGDIHKYTRGLAQACVEQGAEFIYDASVLKILRKLGRVHLEFTQAGSANSQMSQVGDRINIYPVKGYSITVALPDDVSQEAAPWVSLLDDDAKVVTSRLGANRFRIAGTAEFNGVNYDIRDDRIKPLIQWCRQYFPDVDTVQHRTWSSWMDALCSDCRTLRRSSSNANAHG